MTWTADQICDAWTTACLRLREFSLKLTMDSVLETERIEHDGQEAVRVLYSRYGNRLLLLVQLNQQLVEYFGAHGCRVLRSIGLTDGWHSQRPKEPVRLSLLEGKMVELASGGFLIESFVATP